MGNDHRGHNGVFVLAREAQPNFDFWRLKSWFDVRGMTISEVEFGPDDMIVTTSYEDIPNSTTSPLLTVFSFAGQRLGSFIDIEAGVRGASLSRTTRIVKTGPSSYAIYDPGSALIRFVTIKSDQRHPDVRQTRTVPISFSDAKTHWLAFDALPEGQIAIVRTVVDVNRHARTIVSILAPDAKVIEEWQSPRVWQYAYVEDHVLRGCYLSSGESEIVVRSVSINH
jgi:hypothetical protein